MNDIQKAMKDMKDVISKYPGLKTDLEDSFELMIDEIESGESENNELDHFYSYMDGEVKRIGFLTT